MNWKDITEWLKMYYLFIKEKVVMLIKKKHLGKWLGGSLLTKNSKLWERLCSLFWLDQKHGAELNFQILENADNVCERFSHAGPQPFKELRVSITIFPSHLQCNSEQVYPEFYLSIFNGAHSLESVLKMILSQPSLKQSYTFLRPLTSMDLEERNSAYYGTFIHLFIQTANWMEK